MDKVKTLSFLLVMFLASFIFVACCDKIYYEVMSIETKEGLLLYTYSNTEYGIYNRWGFIADNVSYKEIKIKYDLSKCKHTKPELSIMYYEDGDTAHKSVASGVIINNDGTYVTFNVANFKTLTFAESEATKNFNGTYWLKQQRAICAKSRITIEIKCTIEKQPDFSEKFTITF